MPRHKGTRKTGGRQKGTPNKVTAEVREAAEAMIDDPVYRDKLKADLQRRKVAPPVEQMLWYYAKGKPKETIEHQGIGANPTLADDAGLKQRLIELADKL